MAGGAAVAGAGPRALAQVASPAVRRKVKITYWNWADNPTHQKISTDSVAMFNASQNLIEVEVDANMAVMESRKKLVVSYAAGAPPDVIMTVQYWLQDYFDNGILHPLDDYFNKWADRTDFFITKTSDVWSAIHQTSFAAIQPMLEKYSTWLWDPIAKTVLAQPAWLVLAVIGIALIIIGRKKKPLIGYGRD